MDNNPFEPPQVDESLAASITERSETTNHSLSLPMLAVIGSCAGAWVGGAIYVVYAIAFELLVLPTLLAPGQPMQSYGQQGGIMALFAAILGCSVGLTVVFMNRHKRLVGGAVSVLGSLFVATQVLSLWEFSLERNGPDPTDWILYVPLTGFSSGVFCFGAFVFLVGIVARLNSLAHRLTTTHAR